MSNVSKFQYKSQRARRIEEDYGVDIHFWEDINHDMSASDGKKQIIGMIFSVFFDELWYTNLCLNIPKRLARADVRSYPSIASLLENSILLDDRVFECNVEISPPDSFGTVHIRIDGTLAGTGESFSMIGELSDFTQSDFRGAFNIQ